LTLAQLGADVIRVEPIGGAADRRRWPLTDDGTSLYWAGLNQGKQALEVDLNTHRGRQLVTDLIVDSGADGGIVVTNSERWPQLGFEQLRRLRDDLIHVRLAGMDDGSPAVDYTVQARSGFPAITGPEGSETAVNHPLPAWDLLAGLYLTTGLLAAVARRRRSGEGAQVRVALENVALAASGYLGFLAQAQVAPRPPRRRDGNFVYGTFGHDFVTRDEQRVMIVTLTRRQWLDLVAVTGMGGRFASLEARTGARFDDEGDRYRYRHQLADEFSAWFARHDANDIAQRLGPTHVLWSFYATFADLAADDARLMREHPLFEPVDQVGVGCILAPGSPLEIDRSRRGPAPAPAIGQDTRRILTERLALSPSELHFLSAAGVVGTVESGPGT